MTIEEEFFKCFGIKGEVNYTCPVDCGIEPPQMRFKCPDCEMNNTQIYIIYPEITDRILLELICILNDFEGIDVKATTINELKEELLKQCIEPFKYPIAFEEHYEFNKLYHQVQSLFKGGGMNKKCELEK